MFHSQHNHLATQQPRHSESNWFMVFPSSPFCCIVWVLVSERSAAHYLEKNKTTSCILQLLSKAVTRASCCDAAMVKRSFRGFRHCSSSQPTAICNLGPQSSQCRLIIR